MELILFSRSQPTDNINSQELNPKNYQQPELAKGQLPELVIQRLSPPLYALIIGIDIYQDAGVKQLGGAVADANDVELFLRETIGVPKEQIKSLRNHQASRLAIQNAICDLANDSRIKENDPILIYYGGHGAETEAPAGWPSAGGKVQMLVPYDFIPSGTNDPSRGQGILDIVLGHLIERLAKKKGDNITVILDSCYSGSGTRNEANSSYSTRSIELPKNYIIPMVLLKDAMGNYRGTDISKGYVKSGLKSHVLLSACMRGETAKERYGRGNFTQALVKLWREEGVESLTYRDIICRLPDLFSQNPQCEGDNQSRIIFNSTVTSHGCDVYPLTVVQPDGFVIKAGEAHGITAGAEFTIYADQSMSNALGKLRALEPTAFETPLTFVENESHFKVLQGAFALQTRAGRGFDVKFLIETDDKFLDIIHIVKEEMQRKDLAKRSFGLVGARNEQPNLILTFNYELVTFEIMDPTCRKYGLMHMPFDINADVDSLYPVLRSSADFYWHLRRSAEKSIIAPQIRLECTRLIVAGGCDDEMEETLMPDQDTGNLNIDSVIHVSVDDDTWYGFKIINLSAIPLYISLFYFDMSDLSITSYYQPSFAKTGFAEPSIPAGESLTIGYGDGGAAPQAYFLRPNQNIDIGFLKLFISTEYLDLSTISQNSPFDNKRFFKVAPLDRKAVWDTMLITVIQTEKATRAA